MRKLILIAVFLSAFTGIYPGTTGFVFGTVDQNRPVIIMAGFSNTPFTFTSLNGGTLEIVALVSGGTGATTVEAFLDSPTPSGGVETTRFGSLTDPEGDGIYSLVIEGLPGQAISPGVFSGIRLVATDSRGNRAIWPALDVPLASSALEVIDVEPSRVNLAAADETAQLRVTGRFQDGSAGDITNPVTGTTYLSEDTAFATVSPTGLVTAVSEGTAIITVRNGGLSDIAGIRVRLERPRLLNIVVAGPSTINLTSIGQTQQLTVNGNFSDGSTRDVTGGNSGTTYESSDERVATAGPDGIVTAVGNGTVIITVSNSDLSNIVGVLVRANTQSGGSQTPSLLSLSIEGAPDITITPPGATSQLAVRGEFSDGSHTDLTTASTGTVYSSNDPVTATVSADGLVTGQRQGRATITVTNGNRSATIVVSVSTLTSIQLAGSQTIRLSGAGQTAQLRAVGSFSDGSTSDLTSAASGTTYSSSDTNVATVAADGLITATGLGTAIITANNASFSDIVGLFVAADTPAVASISVNPSSDFVLTRFGATRQLVVNGALANGSTLDITSASSGTTYTSSDSAIASVSSEGLVTASGLGSTSITIRNGSASVVTNVTVRPDSTSLLSLSISPATLSFSGVGLTASLSVLGNYTDGSAINLTSSSTGTTYSSSDEAVVRVDPSGNVVAVNRGSASITALNSNVSASIPVTVSF